MNKRWTVLTLVMALGLCGLMGCGNGNSSALDPENPNNTLGTGTNGSNLGTTGTTNPGGTTTPPPVDPPGN